MSETKRNLSELKKSTEVLKKISELSSDQLENVSGGYWESTGYASGYWIQCPNCGRSGTGDFNTWADTDQDCDWFICKCGCSFAVDAYGYYYV